jgi:hypothetical protein
MRIHRAFLPFALLALMPAASLAATSTSSVEAMTSTVFQESQTSFSGIGVRVAFQPSGLLPGISFVPGLEYWRNSTRVNAYQISANRRDATINLGARYLFHFRNVGPYLGAGLAMHFLSTEVEAPSLGLPRAETALAKGGISALGGVMFPLGGRLQNFIELEYHDVADYRQLKLGFGIAFGL